MWHMPPDNAAPGRAWTCPLKNKQQVQFLSWCRHCTFRWLLLCKMAPWTETIEAADVVILPFALKSPACSACPPTVSARCLVQRGLWPCHSWIAHLACPML